VGASIGYVKVRAHKVRDKVFKEPANKTSDHGCAHGQIAGVDRSLRGSSGTRPRASCNFKAVHHAVEREASKLRQPQVRFDVTEDSLPILAGAKKDQRDCMTKD
jgi:hypothetical protein